MLQHWCRAAREKNHRVLGVWGREGSEPWMHLKFCLFCFLANPALFRSYWFCASKWFEDGASLILGIKPRSVTQKTIALPDVSALQPLHNNPPFSFPFRLCTSDRKTLLSYRSENMVLTSLICGQAILPIKYPPWRPERQHRGRALPLQVADLGSVTGIPFGPLSITEIPECSLLGPKELTNKTKSYPCHGCLKLILSTLAKGW